MGNPFESATDDEMKAIGAFPTSPGRSGSASQLKDTGLENPDTATVRGLSSINPDINDLGGAPPAPVDEASQAEHFPKQELGIAGTRVAVSPLYQTAPAVSTIDNTSADESHINAMITKQPSVPEKLLPEVLGALAKTYSQVAIPTDNNFATSYSVDADATSETVETARSNYNEPIDAPVVPEQGPHGDNDSLINRTEHVDSDEDEELFVKESNDENLGEDSVPIKLEEGENSHIDLTHSAPQSEAGQIIEPTQNESIVVDKDDEDDQSGTIQNIDDTTVVDDDDCYDDDYDNSDEAMSTVSTDSAQDESGEYRPDSAMESDDSKLSRKRQTIIQKKTQGTVISQPRQNVPNMTDETLAEYKVLAEQLKDCNDEKTQKMGRFVRGEAISPEEQQSMPIIQKRIDELQQKLRLFSDPTRLREASSGGLAPVQSTGEGRKKIVKKAGKKAGKKARTARQWFERDNEARKNAIEKKRKILHHVPVAAPPQAGNPNKRQKRVSQNGNGTAKNTEHTDKKASLSFAKLQYSNPMQARMARSELLNPEDFAASTKAAQLAQHTENLPDGFDTDIIKADQCKINRASKTFGLNNCKPINNKWAIKGMRTPLFNHQMLGASWMLEREFGQDKGGVNADEMGMGKTIQTLTTIVSNPPTDDDIALGRRTTLIVAPSNVVPQWLKEIEDHVDPKYLEDNHQYKVSKNESLRSLMKKDVIVTTYHEVRSAFYPKYVRKFIESDECSHEKELELREEHLGFLFKIPFHRVVLDEAHEIKDPNTQTSIACRNLDATYRWCLSGTPIHNKVEELWPYFSFLHVSWAQSLNKFCQQIKNLEHPDNKKAFQTAISEVFQRRTMEDMLLGKRIYSIPDCFEEVISFPLTKEEQLIYRTVEGRFRKIINILLHRRRKKGCPPTKVTDLKIYMVFLIRLRQATAHPFLLEPAMKTTLKLEDLTKIADGLKRHGGKIKVIEQIRNWRAKNLDTQALQNLAAPDATEFGMGTFGHELDMEKHIQLVMAARDESICTICTGLLNVPTLGECEHVFCKTCIDLELMKAARNNLGNAFCPVCDTPLRNLRDREESTVSMDDDEDDVSSIVRGLNGACDPIGRREFRKFQALQDQSKAGNEQIIHDAYGRALGNDLLNRQPSLKKSHTMFLRASDKKFPEPMVPSAKTTMVKSTILQWQAEAPDDKIIIFTQFLEESQILGRMLQTENISFLYFWGELNQKQKQKTLETFRENRDVKVLITSLKCGGVGLNITCANRVIITDPWWNAAIELQANARVFRIGQSKRTHFVTLLAENTIDERIAKLQAEKLQQIEQAMQHSKSTTVEEMASLFGHLTTDKNGCLFIEADYKD